MSVMNLACVDGGVVSQVLLGRVVVHSSPRRVIPSNILCSPGPVFEKFQVGTTFQRWFARFGDKNESRLTKGMIAVLELGEKGSMTT
jgi:hypothetical protein